MASDARSACVVGGGPAGLAAAIALARAGYAVHVVDCATPPVDKACGEGLLPDGIAALAELGVEIPAQAGFPFRGIRFSNVRGTVTADFPNGAARGIRRTVLHELLITRVRELGIRLSWGAKHIRWSYGGISIDGHREKADVVVGADGQNSTIRKQAGLAQISGENRRYGFRRHFRMTPWSPYVELHWRPGMQIYVTPTAPDEVCVAVISRDPHLRLEQALDNFSEVRGRLCGVASCSSEKGALSVSRTLRKVQRGNLILVGDASGSVDAITGEGIGLAFRQAALLTRLLKAGKLEQYTRQHNALMKRTRTMAALLLLLDRHDGIQDRVLVGLVRQPRVFESLLAMHLGARGLGDLCSWRSLDFGRAFLFS